MAERDKSNDGRARGAQPRSSVRMVDVARAAGVSPMTVSRALRGNAAVARGTRERVLEVIDQLGYVPDQIAGGLSSQRSGFVVAAVPSLNNPHFAETVTTLTTTLREAGLQLILGHTDYRQDTEEELLISLLGRRPEAVVLTYDGHTERTKKLLRTADVPVIEIWEAPSDPLEHVVGFSNYEASHALTGKLIRAGYRKLVFLGEKIDEATRGSARRLGFADAMRAAGLDGDRQVSYGCPPISGHTGAAALPRVLQQWPDVDCIVCVSDPCAFGVLTECQRRSIAVPETIAIAGFGNFDVSTLAVPSITTMSVDATAIGRKAGEVVLLARDAAKEGRCLPPQCHHIPAIPQFRQTTRADV
ncbi:MAG: LacI family DNA-binding transcriptional regulator [Pseudomonadota bacterium]